jgi:tetratricopeptide (TPR) repeat protein
MAPIRPLLGGTLASGMLAFVLAAGMASAQTIIIPASAHAAADQAAAIVQARAEIAAGDMRQAVSELAQWVEAHPYAPDAARFLGDLYYREGKLDRAEAIYKRILTYAPHDKETHNRLGVVYATENRIDDAIREFENALPGTDSIRDLVIVHLRKGDFAQYESEMLRAAGDQPTDSDLQEEVGEMFETIDRPADAILYFRRALDNAPRSIAATNGLGMAYLDLHQYEQAEDQFKECLDMDPRNYACLDNLGAAYLETKQYDQARQEIDQAHRIAPERPEAVVNYGYLADARGDWKRAVAYYVQAVTLDPYVPESYVNLGIDYEHHGLYPLAQAALLRGIAAAPYDGRIRFLLGRAYAAQGQTQLALEQLRAAEKSFDPDVAALARDETTHLLNERSSNPQ